MPKSPLEIVQKSNELHGMVNDSAAPLCALSLQATLLLGKEDWLPMDVERACGNVLDLLIREGWTKLETESPSLEHSR